MPKTRRDRIKGDCAMAVRDVREAMEHLNNVERQYEGIHDDLAEALQMAVVGLSTVNDIIVKFLEVSFGYVPDDLERWVNLK